MPASNSALFHYFLQDDLYLLNEDKALYAGKPQAQPEMETKKPEFNYLGSNKSRFLILVSYSADKHMAETHLKALESTLGRKGLTIEDVATLNTARHTENTLAQLLDFFAAEKLLILGQGAILQGLEAPVLNVIEAKPGYMQLYTHSFDEMMADRDKAKNFWDQMKNF